MDTYQKLVLSTQALLWERGYSSTSPKAIQHHSGVGQGSMYHHFDGKEDLALAAIQLSAKELRAQAELDLSGEGAAIDRIARFLLRERQVLRGCRIGRLTQDPEVMESSKLREPLRETFDWLVHRLADVVAEGQAAGDISTAFEPLQIGSALLAVLQGGYVLAKSDDSVESFDRAIRGVLSLLRKAT